MYELDADLVAFTRKTFRSLWAIETLFLIMRQSPLSLTKAELVRELRGTPQLVDGCIEQLVGAGLIARHDDNVSFPPGDADLATIARKLEQLYRERPTALIRIMQRDRSDIQSFSDAFRFKEPKE
jgi:hypothetical protein